jgi:uncharacterized protein YlxW (UPF0749 family)
MSTPTESRPQLSRRPDESMTLLNEVMQRPLDPGYAAAAERRRNDPDAGRRHGRRLPVTLLLAVLAGGVLIVGVRDLRLPAALDSHDALTQEIADRTAQVDELDQQVRGLQVEIEKIGTEALAGAGDRVVGRSQLLASTTGASAVVGPGVTVMVDDAEALDDLAGADPREREQAERGRVRDRDLQVVVNGLWSAGAEAVAVNGQRLTAMSSIREAGPAILVNFRPLTPPYEVQAIGDAKSMQVEFATSAAGRYLSSLQQNYGVRASVSGADSLRLPAATGLRLRYAKRPQTTQQPQPPEPPAQTQQSPTPPPEDTP